MTPREIIREEAAKLRPARLASDYAKAPQERRDALDDALIFQMYNLAGPYLRGYPTFDIASRVILGATPQEVAPGLTRAEAASFISQTEHREPATFLGETIKKEYGLNSNARSEHVAVWRWVQSCLSSPSRASSARKYATRIDELKPCDLEKSVSQSFRNAEIRQALDNWDGPNELIPPEPWHDTLPEGLTVLRTATELFLEGKHQSHCVGSYAESVFRKSCIIVRVEAEGNRSTAEVRDGKVVQHLGAFNRRPHPACIDLLKLAGFSRA